MLGADEVGARGRRRGRLTRQSVFSGVDSYSVLYTIHKMEHLVKINGGCAFVWREPASKDKVRLGKPVNDSRKGDEYVSVCKKTVGEAEAGQGWVLRGSTVCH